MSVIDNLNLDITLILTNLIFMSNLISFPAELSITKVL